MATAFESREGVRTGLDVERLIAELRTRRDGRWAWGNYLDTVRDLIAGIPAKSIIEIGGGRAPSFSQDEVHQMGVQYTSNDISERELSLAPDWVAKAHFDIQSPRWDDIAPFAESYDLAFSKMVMEHVSNYKRAYTNIHSILRPGGVSIAFHPVLYSVPFVLNRLIPEAASERILSKIFPNRVDSGIPKFPAVYSGCRISSSVRDTIQSLGFSEVWQVPFYWHNYYSKFPVIRDVHKVVSDLVQKSDFTPLATFAFTVVRK